jgi:hypothetical protein
MRSIKPALAAAFMLSSALAGFPSAAHATATDGDWRVVIITEKGSCDRAYSYNVNIANGRVNYSGSSLVHMGGTVSPSGAVKVNISAGNKGASGSGHLSANEGVGTWRGHGSGAECAGRWEAQRL